MAPPAGTVHLRLALGALALLGLVTAGTVPAAAVATPASADAAGLAADRSASEVVLRLALLPERPGWVEVEATVLLADTVVELEVERLPEGATVTSTAGFQLRGGRYTWDGTTPTPRVTYRVPVDMRHGNLRLAGNGSWHLLMPDRLGPVFSPRWSAPPETWPWPKTTVADENVSVGESLVFLGPHETFLHEAGGQEFLLVVPAVASVREDRAEVWAALAYAATALNVGARSDRVTVFVVTDEMVDGAGGGSVSPPGPTRDIYVHEGLLLNTTTSVWVHEYVHARQAYDVTDETAWLVEATAAYYAPLFALHQGRISPAKFHRFVSIPLDEDEVLATPTEWSHAGVHYSKGARVVAALDLEIRRVSGGNASFEDVFRAMNSHEGPVGHDDFRATVAAAAGAPLDDWLERYVSTSAAPAVSDDPWAFAGAGDEDPDGDGLSNDEEARRGTSPFLRPDGDFDGDGIGNHEESRLGADPYSRDSDEDGIFDDVELQRGLDPASNDTDRDGVPDGVEDRLGTDPLNADTDGDGLDDADELLGRGGNATDPDTDRDGLLDGDEVARGSDPTNPYTDGDDLMDGDEVARGTDPTLADTDGDGIDDDDEIARGTDPTVADTDGNGIEAGSDAPGSEVRTSPQDRSFDGWLEDFVGRLVGLLRGLF